MSESSVKKLHCPNCKSHNISISTESSISGAVTSTQGNISATSVSNKHRNFWFCADCGTKFRNIQNLEEEIHKNRFSHIIFWIVGGVSLAAFIWLLSETMDDFGMILLPYTVGAFVFAVVFIVGGFINKRDLTKYKKELEYLKENCFN